MTDDNLSKNRLGTILVEAGVISREDLYTLLQQQRGTNKRLGQVAIELGLATEEQIVKALARQLKIPFITLDSAMVDPAVLDLISENRAREMRVLPLYKVDKNLIIAMADPTDSEALKEIRFVTGCEIEAVVAKPREILDAIDQFYGANNSMMDAIQSIATGGVDATEDSDDEEDEYCAYEE